MKIRKILKSKLGLLLILVGVFLFTGIIILTNTRDKGQEVEQYYINKSYCLHRVRDEKSGMTSCEREAVITEYDEYMETFGEDDEVLSLLQNVVDKDFFNDHSLIMLGDSMRNADSYVSRIDTASNPTVVNITVKSVERNCFANYKSRN